MEQAILDNNDAPVEGDYETGPGVAGPAVPAPVLEPGRANTGPKGVLADYREACEKAEKKMKERWADAYKQIESESFSALTFDEEERLRELEKRVEEEFDDAQEDKEAFSEFRRRRLAEMLLEQSRPKFGQVKQLTTDTYMITVAEADPTTVIVIHIFSQTARVCAMINEYLESLAGKYPQVLFCKITKEDCLETFDERVLPSLLVYNRGELVKCHMKVTNELGFAFTAKDVEQMLDTDGVFDCNFPDRKEAVPILDSDAESDGTEPEDD
eukprot:m51a1_g6780 hypothetical protein (270) ;mRNA; r:134502-135810